AAKKLVAFDCGIDFLAGPTEAVFISEEGDPIFIACDLVAQAEHDPDALCIFITTSRGLAKAVQLEVQRRTRTNLVAAESLSRRGAIFLVASLDDAVETSNHIAPEHLTLPSALAPAIKNAGSIFLNEFTPQSAGDYISGPNHVLPTGVMARVRGGLSVLDYVRIISCQEVSSAGMREIARTGIALAEAEGLMGHAESLRVRLSHA
ncbi:MAG: histidinol dehydrogenase, partial [Candidatus Sulfotelmatobacter sp.]